MIILNGCASTDALIAPVNDYCFRYESIKLYEYDFKNIKEIRINQDHRTTIDKFIDNITINEREYQRCIEKPNANN